MEKFPEFLYNFLELFCYPNRKGFAAFVSGHRNYRSLDRKYRVAVTTVATVARTVAMADPHLLPSRCSAPLGLSDPVALTCSPLTPHLFPHAQEPNPNPSSRSSPAAPRRRRGCRARRRQLRSPQLELKPPSAPPRSPLPLRRRNRPEPPQNTVAARSSPPPAVAPPGRLTPSSTTTDTVEQLLTLRVSPRSS